jgi:3-hydroxypropanoate dehydrogenase
MATLTEADFKLLFHDARTYRAWTGEPVSDETLVELYSLVRLPPTSGNCQPARIVFVRSPAAKERLKPALDAGNVDKTMTAPVTAIVAYDTEYHLKLQQLNPHSKNVVEKAAQRSLESRMREATFSATLQAAYLILAARGLGLDCGPMGGFNADMVNAEFFPDGKWKAVGVLVNLGRGDASKLHPRAPRLSFDEACLVL